MSAWHNAENALTVEIAGGSDCPTSALALTGADSTSADGAFATWFWQSSHFAGTAPAAARSPLPNWLITSFRWRKAPTTSTIFNPFADPAMPFRPLESVSSDNSPIHSLCGGRRSNLARVIELEIVRSNGERAPSPRPNRSRSNVVA